MKNCLHCSLEYIFITIVSEIFCEYCVSSPGKQSRKSIEILSTFWLFFRWWRSLRTNRHGSRRPILILSEAPTKVLAETLTEILVQVLVKAPAEVLAEVLAEAPAEAPAEALAEALAEVPTKIQIWTPADPTLTRMMPPTVKVTSVIHWKPYRAIPATGQWSPPPRTMGPSQLSSSGISSILVGFPEISSIQLKANLFKKHEDFSHIENLEYDVNQIYLNPNWKWGTRSFKQ